MHPTLNALGWNDDLERAFDQHHAAGLVPARVAVHHRNAYTVVDSVGEAPAIVPGAMLNRARGPGELPSVGDWVALERPSAGRGIIRAILPRRTALTRRAAGRQEVEQVVAANIDHVVLVTSLNHDLNIRRLERYLTAAWDSGATPAVALTKADLCDDPAGRLLEVEAALPGIEVLVISAHLGTGLDDLWHLAAPHRSIVLVGSSGVGKSTLVNALAEDVLLEVKDLRDDGKGRHTTTFRKLVCLRNGGVVIDTPGMRELQLWSGDLEETFADIVELAAGCRFNDCAHRTEPGCAVQEAIAEGRLTEERFHSYLKLQRELRFRAAKKDRAVAAEERRRIKRFGREVKEATTRRQ